MNFSIKEQEKYPKIIINPHVRLVLPSVRLRFRVESLGFVVR